VIASNEACRLAALPALGIIVVAGADAAAFLAAQLGRSPPARDRSQGSLAAWHDAKGRVQALFRVFNAAEDRFWLTTPANAAAGIVEDLRRFVLRSRVELLIDDGELGCVALVGLCTQPIESRLLTAPVSPHLRYVIGPATAVTTLRTTLPGAPAAAVDLEEIRLRIPSLDARLRGQFLPQMLDLDRLGAVEFDKGCYPGQEVIVRIQHRGSVKRHLIRLEGPSTSEAPAPATTLLDTAGRRVGQIVRAAVSSNGLEALAVIDRAATTGALRLDDDESHTLMPVSES
jgi:folate-binding protein YgfZ